MRNRPRFPLIAAPLAFALLVALVSPASAVLNGREDDGRYPFVGTLIQDLDRPENEGLEVIAAGTGFLLSPRVVLTAAHNGLARPNWPVVGVGFTVDPHPGAHPDPDLYGPGGQRRINGTIVRPPGWPEWNDRDYALMILDEPVEGVDQFAELPKVGLVDEVFSDGTGPQLTIVGYGLAGEEALTDAERAELPPRDPESNARGQYLREHTLGVRRVGTQTFIGPESPLFQPDTDLARWLRTEGSPSVACPGDSGAPVFLADSRTVLGVERAEGCGRSPVTSYHRLDTPEVLEWIAETMEGGR